MCGSQGKRKRNGGKKVNCYVEHEKGGGVLIRITIVPRSQPRQSPRCKLSDPAPPHSSAVFSSSDIIVIPNGRVEEKRKRKELFIFFAPCFLLCPSSVAFGVDGEEGGACDTAMGGDGMRRTRALPKLPPNPPGLLSPASLNAGGGGGGAAFFPPTVGAPSTSQLSTHAQERGELQREKSRRPLPPSWQEEDGGLEQQQQQLLSLASVRYLPPF